MARKLAVVVAAALVVGVLVPEALAQYRGGVAPPDAATDSGDAINRLYWIVLAMVAFVFVLVEATLLFFIVRFRRRRGAPTSVEGPQIHGNPRLEVIWTAIPTALLIGLAVYTVLSIPDVEAEATVGEAKDRVVVDVDAHQFYWQYRYENGALSFDKLYLPVDAPVELRIRSADVPHSWWVPELTGKKDAIPGQTNVLRFVPQETGTFARGECGELCGIQHAFMLTSVEVLRRSEFERWLGENESPDDEELGRAEWTASCAKCHGTNGEGDIGPPIARNPTLVDVESLNEIVRVAGQDLETNESYMPPTGKGWTDAQLEALVAYVKSSETLAPQTEGGS